MGFAYESNKTYTADNNEILYVRDATDADMDLVNKAIGRNLTRLQKINFYRCQFSTLSVQKYAKNKNWVWVSFQDSTIGTLRFGLGMDLILVHSNVGKFECGGPFNMAIAKSAFPFKQASGYVKSIMVGSGVPLLQPYLSGFQSVKTKAESKLVFNPDDFPYYQMLPSLCALSVFRAKLAMVQAGGPLRANAHF